MNNQLFVYCNESFVGELTVTQQRELEFQYTSSWIEDPDAYPLSVRLPLRAELYLDERARPFFENLLPEFQIRNTIAHQLGVSEKNIFGILKGIGGECAGAVSLLVDKRPTTQLGEYKLISENQLDEWVNELPKNPLMTVQHRRLSLAGAQHKLPLYIKEGQFYLPQGSSVSSHILKPPIAGFQGSVINEFFSMVLAKNMGLPVPKVSLYGTRVSFYIIERFDRQLDQNNHLTRIHQEDFCQALGVLSEQKYEAEGGPSLKNCIDLVREFSISPAIDIKNLINWIIFNYIIGNADAHGKNLTFLITHQGPQLSPFYDMLSTNIYPELLENYAMKVGGENRPRWIQKRHWERLSEVLNLKFKVILSSMENSIERYDEALSRTVQELGNLEENQEKVVSKIIEITKKRIENLKALVIGSA